jgi:hypothetical protein
VVVRQRRRGVVKTHSLFVAITANTGVRFGWPVCPRRRALRRVAGATSWIPNVLLLCRGGIRRQTSFPLYDPNRRAPVGGSPRSIRFNPTAAIQVLCTQHPFVECRGYTFLAIWLNTSSPATASVQYIPSLPYHGSPMYLSDFDNVIVLIVAIVSSSSASDSRINPRADHDHQPQADSFVGSRLKYLSVFALQGGWRKKRSCGWTAASRFGTFSIHQAFRIAISGHADYAFRPSRGVVACDGHGIDAIGCQHCIRTAQPVPCRVKCDERENQQQSSGPEPPGAAQFPRVRARPSSSFFVHKPADLQQRGPATIRTASSLTHSNSSPRFSTWAALHARTRSESDCSIPTATAVLFGHSRVLNHKRYARSAAVYRSDHLSGVTRGPQCPPKTKRSGNAKARRPEPQICDSGRRSRVERWVNALQN